MSEDSDWIADYVRRGLVTRSEIMRLPVGLKAEREREAAERLRAEEQDWREWIDSVRRRLGLVAEVHEYRTWQIGENYWAWACLRPGCVYTEGRGRVNAESSKARVVSRAAAHRRKYLPLPSETVAGAGLDLTGWGPQA